jgi:hypothetical protein
MQLIKKFGRGFLTLLLKLSLFLFAISCALAMVFGSPTQLKRSLKESGVYNGFVDNVIASSAEQGGEDQSSLPLNQPEVKSAANSAFPPQFLQSSTEQAIDGTYHWLDGKTPVPDFKIDLTGPKQNFANALGDYAVNRAQKLPRCTLAQLRELQTDGIDPFNTPCVPPGFDLASLRTDVINEINGSNDFLADPVVTANTLPKDEQGKTVFQNLSQVPKIFHWLKLAPIIFGIIAVLSGSGLILLYEHRRRGIRSVGITFLGTGVFLLIGAWLENYLVHRANSPNGRLARQLTGNGLQGPILHLFASLNTAFNHKIYPLCGLYVLLGAATLLILHFTKPKALATAATIGHTRPTGDPSEIPATIGIDKKAR